MSLAVRPPSPSALHESPPFRLPGQAWTRRRPAVGATRLLSPSGTWPSCCPLLQEGPGAGMTLGSRRASGRDARVPSFGSKEPAPPPQHRPGRIVQVPPSLCSRCQVWSIKCCTIASVPSGSPRAVGLEGSFCGEAQALFTTGTLDETCLFPQAPVPPSPTVLSRLLSCSGGAPGPGTKPVVYSPVILGLSSAESRRCGTFCSDS